MIFDPLMLSRMSDNECRENLSNCKELLDTCVTDYDMLNADYIKLEGENNYLRKEIDKLTMQRDETRKLLSQWSNECGQRVSDLETALRDMIVVAEFDQWNESLTGKRLILNAAKQLLETKEDKS